MTTTSTEIRIVLSDAWSNITRLGLRCGSPDVGMSRIELVGNAEAWAKARAYIAACREKATGARKASATAALARIDHALS